MHTSHRVGVLKNKKDPCGSFLFMQSDVLCIHMDNTQEQTIADRLTTLESKVDAVYQSVEKTRMYFRVVLWVTVGAVVLPMVALVVIIPTFLSSYLDALDGLL